MKPRTVDEYIEGFSEYQVQKLVELREVVRLVLPDTYEVLKWSSPAMVEKDGMILVVFSGHKHHMNLVVTPSTREAFKDRLAGHMTGKGSLKLPYDKPLPAELIKEMLKYRAKEYREHGVKWM